MSFGWSDFVGGIGVVILMITFLLLQLGRLESNTLTYSLLNALGATLITISLLFNFNLSAFIMEVFWILISLVGVFRTLRSRKYKADEFTSHKSPQQNSV
jgi:hypothetical protein